jgi:hypothetical protein
MIITKMKIFRILFVLILVYFFIGERVEAAYNPFKPDIIKLTNTVLNDADFDPFQQFDDFNTTAIVNTDTDGDVFTSVTTNGVVCIPGTYLINIVLYQTSPDDDTSIGVEVTIDGVGTGVLGATGYIAHSDGHNEATTIVSDSVDLTTTSKIGFDLGRLAENKSVAIPVGKSSISITRIKD